MTGRQLLHALTLFFGNTEYENEIFYLLVVPFFIFLIVLLLTNRSRGLKNALSKISKTDMQAIEAIRLQKGLEVFDRDFLIEIALIQNEKPCYLLIDSGVFDRVQKQLKLDLIEKGEKPENNNRYKLLSKLREKLF